MFKFRRNNLFSGITIFFLLIVVPFGFAFGAEPKPGDVIDASNIEQYADYFPPSQKRFFTDGYGISPLLAVHVREYEPNLPPKSYREITEKYAGKTKINADGSLNGYEAGMPFPDPQEPNKALKVMYNFQYRWRGDDYWYPGGYILIDKRKGNNGTSKRANIKQLKYKHRTVLDPKPALNNPKDLHFAWLYLAMSPPNKDMTTLTWRYDDPFKNDDMWCYVPTLRRTLRLMSSERSTPVNGTPYTWDDFYGFDGQTLGFNYTLLGEKPMLGICHQQSVADDPNCKIKDGFSEAILGGPEDPYELGDTYIIEGASKDPKHPESKKILYIHKEMMAVLQAETFDKKGDLWKINYGGYRPVQTTRGETGPWVASGCMCDVKTGFYSTVLLAAPSIDNGWDPRIFAPAMIEPY